MIQHDPPMILARAILLLLSIYAAIGAAFATAFIIRGAARIDPAARGGSLAFRLLLWPGALALWPLLLTKWMTATRGSRTPHPSDPHPPEHAR